MLKILKVNKSFRSLWFGQLISALGDRLTQMGILTFLMVVGQDKGDKVALITFFSLLPFLLFGPLFGALADRYSRKQLMLFADLARALLVIFIPMLWLYTHSVAIMVLWFFTLGSLSALFTPAKMSIISNIAEKDTLLEANSLIVTTGMVAMLVGTLIAGAVINLAGVKPAFFINGLTYFISAIFVLRISYKRPAVEKLALGTAYATLLNDIKVGIRYIRRHRIILRLILLSSAFSFISSFAYILILNYGSSVLKQGPLGIGFLLSAAGLGMIAGSLILIKKKDSVNYGKTMALAFAAIGMSALLLFLRPAFYITIIILFFAGIGSAVVTVAFDTMFGRVVPDELKGKIFAARGLFTSSVFLLSLLAVGQLIKYLNATLLFGMLGLITVAVALGIILYEKRWGYQLLRLFLTLILKSYFGFKVSGKENLPKTARVIFAGNHTSVIDGVTLMCAYRGRIYFLVADSIFETMPWGWIARRMGYISIKRGGFNKESIRQAIALLKAGYSIGIFPEGHIAADGQLDQGKEGVALISRLAGVDVVPFAIEGAYEAWPLPKKYPRRFPVSIHFNQPIDISAYPVREELAQEVMQEISRAKLYLEREGYLRVEPDEIVKYLLNMG
jgi:DHA3 family macrolide efflux protein-like MFS transporter